MDKKELLKNTILSLDSDSFLNLKLISLENFSDLIFLMILKSLRVFLLKNSMITLRK